MVTAGQRLFQIDPAPFRAEADIASAALQRAEAALARARSQVERLEPLVEIHAVSQEAFDDAVSQRNLASAEVAQARATLARRQLDLKFSSVDSPISGRIEQAIVTEGSLVTPNDTSALARVYQIDQVYVDVRQPASSFESIQEGMNALSGNPRGDRVLMATILRESGAIHPETGRVLFSGVSVDAGTGDVLLRVLVNNRDATLLPGMYVRARVPLKRHLDGFAVPQEAVHHANGAAYLWTLDTEDKALRKKVTLGERLGGRYRISAGLQAGQRVVVEGGERLGDGVAVTAKPWTAAKPPPFATDARAARS